MDIDDIFLIAIVEVEFEKRILCQAPGCGHAVYRKVHIVLVAGHFVLLGSDCYRRLYGGGIARLPFYTWGADRKLTDEERQRLLENTAAFIEQLDAELARTAPDPLPLPAAHNVSCSTYDQVRILTPPANGRGIAESTRMRVLFKLQSYADEDEYCGPHMLSWRWAGTEAEINQLASTWAPQIVFESDHDLVMRSYEHTLPTNPYIFALNVEHACRLPKFRTLRVLHELGLTTK